MIVANPTAMAWVVTRKEMYSCHSAAKPQRPAWSALTIMDNARSCPAPSRMMVSTGAARSVASRTAAARRT